MRFCCNIRLYLTVLTFIVSSWTVIKWPFTLLQYFSVSATLRCANFNSRIPQPAFLKVAEVEKHYSKLKNGKSKKKKTVRESNKTRITWKSWACNTYSIFLESQRWKSRMKTSILNKWLAFCSKELTFSELNNILLGSIAFQFSFHYKYCVFSPSRVYINLHK